MEVTVPALREISDAAALDLDTKKHNYATIWWAKKGRKKALRAAKKGSKTAKVIIRSKYRVATKNFLKSRGFDVWDVEKGPLFSTIRFSW